MDIFIMVWVLIAVMFLLQGFKSYKDGWINKKAFTFALVAILL